MYLGDEGQLPPLDTDVPSTMTSNRLAIMAAYLGMVLPPGPLVSWPPRKQQPKWFNCPMAAASGCADGLTLGGGVYTGYEYTGGVEESAMVALGLATMVNPGRAVDLRARRRGGAASCGLTFWMSSSLATPGATSSFTAGTEPNIRISFFTPPIWTA